MPCSSSSSGEKQQSRVTTSANDLSIAANCGKLRTLILSNSHVLVTFDVCRITVPILSECDNWATVFCHRLSVNLVTRRDRCSSSRCTTGCQPLYVTCPLRSTVLYSSRHWNTRWFRSLVNDRFTLLACRDVTASWQRSADRWTASFFQSDEHCIW